MPGMELTAEALRAMDANLDFRQQIAVKAALGSARLGLLPETDFSCKGVFVKNAFEVDSLRCTAILASGRILSIDEEVVLQIPMLYGSEYYLTASIGEGRKEYEVEGVGYTRPQYVFAFHPLTDLPTDDLFPLLRFKVSDGVFSIDEKFIPPCLLLSADKRFSEYAAGYAGKLEKLSQHGSMEDGEGKRAILRYLFFLKGLNREGTVHEFIQMTQEIAQAVDYYIVAAHTENRIQIPTPNQYDIQKWLQWMDDYLTGAISIMDTVVLEDHTIDYDALLAQAKKELYDQLNPELYEKLLEKIKNELRDELTQRLTDSLQEFLSKTIRPELYSNLNVELNETLYEKLYMELFEHLFNALYIPENDDPEFFPII